MARAIAAKTGPTSTTRGKSRFGSFSSYSAQRPPLASIMFVTVAAVLPSPRAGREPARHLTVDGSRSSPFAR